MDSRFNIPAPAVVKRESDVCVERGRRLKVTVPQADVEASAKADSLKQCTKKTSRVFPRSPVP